MSNQEIREKTLLNVEYVRFILDLIKTSTYRFLNDNPPFKVFRINGAIRISSKSFFDWIDA